MKPILLTSTANRVIDHVCMRQGVSPARIRQRDRRPDAVAARRQVCRVLRRLGYSLPMIGYAVERDHTTVLHHLRREAR